MDRGVPLAASLAPTLLLSMPQLLDPNFAQTVVLLCRHDAEGAFGLVVNRQLPALARIVVEGEPEDSWTELPVWQGGPVQPERSWILLAEDPGDVEAMPVGDGLYLSTSSALLQRLTTPSPPRGRLIVGYAGWGPGQLDAELHASAWLMLDATADLVFDTPADAMWEAAIRRLGADPGALHISHGVH